MRLPNTSPRAGAPQPGCPLGWDLGQGSPRLGTQLLGRQGLGFSEFRQDYIYTLPKCRKSPLGGKTRSLGGSPTGRGGLVDRVGPGTGGIDGGRPARGTEMMTQSGSQTPTWLGYTCPICEGENVRPDPKFPGLGICPDCGAQDISIAPSMGEGADVGGLPRGHDERGAS